MIDKITIHIRDIHTEAPALIAIEKRANFAVKNLSHSGYVAMYKNIRIVRRGQRATIEGSIAKFGQGNNAANVDKDTCKRFVKAFMKDLQLKPKTVISQIEVGFNLNISQKAAAYVNQIKTAKSYAKTVRVVNKGIMFVKNQKKIRIYDKTKHYYNAVPSSAALAKAPDILRYELVLKDPTYVGSDTFPLMLAHLMCNPVLDELIAMWMEEFEKIIFEPVVLPIVKIDRPNQFKNHLVLKGIEAYGGLSNVLTLIQNVKANQYPAQCKQRLRKFVSTVAKQAPLVKRNSVDTELQTKIAATGKRYLANAGKMPL